MRCVACKHARYDDPPRMYGGRPMPYNRFGNYSAYCRLYSALYPARKERRLSNRYMPYGRIHSAASPSIGFWWWKRKGWRRKIKGSGAPTWCPYRN
jgi:hypothetical protein